MLRGTSLQHLTVLALCTICLVDSVFCLWPQPAHLQTGKSARKVSSSFSISIPSSSSKDHDLVNACQRALSRINVLPVEMYVEDRGASQRKAITSSTPLKKLAIEIGDKASFDIQWNKNWNNQSVVDFSLGESLRFQRRSLAPKSISALTLQPLEKLDESYSLTIPEGSGEAVLKAGNALGALRGLATFAQLVYRLPGNKDGSDVKYIPHLPIKIEDKTAFPYRGIMLDTARNYLPVASIKKTIDVMETVKMNVLHWHITDGQSFPLKLETKGLGVLAGKGAYSNEMTYDKAIIADLVAYAASRGVNIVPEIDMPGHMYEGVKDYPGDLITCGNQKSWSDWANEPPSGHLDIRKPAATQFIKDLLNEATTYLPGPYFSTGNDEINAHCYGLAAGDNAGIDKILKPFVDAIHTHLVGLKRTPVVWEEAAITFPETGKILKPGTIVEAWTSSANVEKILQSNKDVRIIHAPSDYFYLDCGMGGWLSNSADGQSWCPFVSWQKQYSFDPLNGTANVVDGPKRVLGGESALWSEQVDSGNLDSLLWPRALSGAEVFWTGADFTANGKQEKRSLLQAENRLHEMRGRVRAMGVLTSPIQPLWCALRPGSCMGGAGLA
ncbi:hypothetical protein CBS101457_005483 [Exobasidium rhododendri]|nr:hypothetical protein CBS101457_005483 [Exobasidium rhododendri]